MEPAKKLFRDFASLDGTEITFRMNLASDRKDAEIVFPHARSDKRSPQRSFSDSLWARRVRSDLETPGNPWKQALSNSVHFRDPEFARSAPRIYVLPGEQFLIPIA